MPTSRRTERSVPVQLSGREAEPALPALLVPASRGTAPGDDPFLPPGYLRPTAAWDTGPTARDVGSVAPQRHEAAPGEILVLELADGSTLVTSAQRLQAALGQSRPDLIDERDGAVRLEQLRADGAAPQRGFAEALGGLVAKVTACAVGRGATEGPDPIVADALSRLKDPLELGVSWLGTKALMAAIESRLDRAPGLYRWVGATGRPNDLAALDRGAVTGSGADDPLADPARPLLVFVHGTGSNTLGSFGDLRTGDRDLWARLAARYTGGIYAYEHRTLSESPIENARALAEALPRGAHVALVSHSRGGLVADLLCLGEFDALIDHYRYAFPGTGHPDPAESARVRAELETAHAAQREQLRALAATLRERRIVVERYVRTASPANGTLLASGNFDVFLSSLLGLIGLVPFFFGSPWYSAFKRIVVEIARHRTDPHLVPGIEAMLPDSPMARLLRDAPVRPGTTMAVLAGDIQGGHLLRRLGVMLTDFLLFENEDNDLVVNTTSMLAGIAPRVDARVLFDRGADVSHFRYFANADTRSALGAWLSAADPLKLEPFRPLPSAGTYEAALAAATAPRRDAGGVPGHELAATDRPIVVVLPGVMGSHLAVAGGERVWFDAVDLAGGGLAKLAWGTPAVEAEALFAMFYGPLCQHLATSHRVEPFPYDWRQPLDVLAERLGEFLDRLLKATNQPIRLLAHSLGGLVVRAAIVKRRSVMDALMARDGARLVMLGTPHQGAHSMVGNLLGKGNTLRTLVRLDLKHDMQQVLDLVAGFRGALQLLPKPGFVDAFEGEDGGGEPHDWQQAATWQALKGEVTDFWFGDGRAATPSQDVLDAASWLWRADGAATPALPPAYEAASVYVFGVAPNTPCGIRTVVDSGGTPRLKLVGTPHGDGTVTWQSGRIGHIGRYHYLPAAHGDLTATPEHFPALAELLTAGSTARLATAPPAVRAVQQPQPVVYDAGPPTADDPDALQRGLMGGSARNRVPPRPKRRLEITVQAMDLRFVAMPIMVGHYERDAIAGAERLIDRELLAGDLAERQSLGLYAGPRGSATVVLRVPNELERQRGSLSGAVVTGLGSYDRPLSPSDLTEAVRNGALRYLLQVVDVLGKAEREVPLATLLIGYNSSANLTVATSVEALVRGVLEANTKFYETTRLDIRIARLEIVEIYIDTAISAVYALRTLAEPLAAQARQHGTLLVCRRDLVQGEGLRQRLSDDRNASYWPRLIIADADRLDASGAPVRDTPAAAAEPGATPIAERLRFTYVGQRARAESVALQRQPGLIEQLVKQQIADPVWNEDFGRMLFQLMVPHDFKDAARQLDRVVLVVDAYAANLPWELMLADDPERLGEEKLPLALRTAVVRQLATSAYRAQVHQGVERRALVIGNPSVAGFTDAFPRIGGPGATFASQPPPPLPGAEAEARSTARVLGATGYAVETVIGTDQPASAVLNRLFGRPWRLLHVSAHGVYALPHADGRLRSGVLLSDGLLITAAEIAAMESVPELVFLNCCHLGQIGESGGAGSAAPEAGGGDGGGGGGGGSGGVPGAGRGGGNNLLAASVARELIEIGVRCVVVAGWAVGDESARLFAQTFYEALLLRRNAFGDAVFEARRAAYQAYPADITWGAFQAYGEPGWLAEARVPGLVASAAEGTAASPEELLDELARSRADLARLRCQLSDAELAARIDAIATLLQRRCPPAWQTLPQLQSALGRTWYELGQLERARDCLLAAVQSVDRLGLVPIHDIEKLASVEARLGEQRAQAELGRADAGSAAAGGPAGASPGAGQQDARYATGSAEALIDMALKRLDGLDALVATHIPTRSGALDAAADPPPPHAERAGLRGGAWKRKASLQARHLLTGRLRPPEQDDAARRMTECVEKAIDAYRSAEGDPGSSDFSPVHALNRLSLQALTDWASPAERSAAIELAQQCRRAAAQGFAESPSVWEAVWQAEALLVERLIDGSLGRTGDPGRAAFEEIARCYADTTANVTTRPSQLEAMAAQMELLSRLCDAFSVAQHADEALERTGSRLLQLAERLQPGRAPRTDRPGRGRGREVGAVGAEAVVAEAVRAEAVGTAAPAPACTASDAVPTSAASRPAAARRAAKKSKPVSRPAKTVA